jgi:predicted small secreted protein
MDIPKYTSLEEFLKDYEKDPQFYNMLVDMQTIQDIPAMYKPVINMVFISMDREDFEFYLQKNAKNPDGDSYREQRFSLSAKGLFRIRSAAAAKFVRTDTFQDKENKTVTVTVEMQFRDPSGGWSSITQSKTVSTDKPLRNGKSVFDPEAPQKAETGAQNRCIRKAFNVKSHYSIEQLQKPFTIIYLELDETKDDDVKMAKIAASIGATQMLFGSRQNNLKQLASGTIADASTGEVIEGGKI